MATSVMQPKRPTYASVDANPVFYGGIDDNDDSPDTNTQSSNVPTRDACTETPSEWYRQADASVQHPEISYAAAQASAAVLEFEWRNVAPNGGRAKGARRVVKAYGTSTFDVYLYPEPVRSFLAVALCQERDKAIANIRNTSKMREMEEKIQAVRVEAQEWRQMATLLQGQRPSPASAPAPTSPVLASTVNECVMCVDNPANFVIVPCGHVCLCKTCKDALIARRGKCPKCRGVISTTHQVFL